MSGSTRKLFLASVFCGLALLQTTVFSRAQGASYTPQEYATAPTQFRISGTVVNAMTGVPLAQARISLAEIRDRSRVISVVTSENGHFEFSQLPPGKYSLQGAKRGFISAAYDQHEQFSTAIVTGPEFSTDNLVLKLTPMALITGHVFDEYGDPVRHARVFLYLEDHRAGMNRISRLSSSSTDDHGYYDFAQLRPGKYFISVSANPWYAVHPLNAEEGPSQSAQSNVAPGLDVVYPTTYYGGATEADGATPIEVKGGDRQQIELHLNPTPALHLIFRVQEDSSQPNSSIVLQKHVFDSTELESESVYPVAPGVYEVTGVPPGHYTASVGNPATGQREQASDVDLMRDGQEIDTSHGEPLGSLKLTVKMPGEEAVPKQFALALQDSRRRLVAFRQPDPSGLFSFEDLAPGRYSILVAAAGKPYAVVRTSSTAGEVAGHEVTITPGAALELIASLSAGVVSIEGVVQKKDKPVAGIMVALVPKDPEAHIELFRRDQSDFDGTFWLRGVIPGSYTIVAVEDAWDFAWLQPGVLARYVQHGQELTIGEMMRGSVHLPDPVEVQPH
jgi:protocatechuate 3,4-dioxygenase beta subunit